MKVIDIHAHVIPPTLVRAMRSGVAPDDIRIEEAGSQSWVAHRQGYRYPLPDAFHDVPSRLRVMDDAGIDLAVLSVAPPLFLYWIDPSAARDAAVEINDAVAAMVTEAPARFAALATLPMQDAMAAATELRRCVNELGMVGAFVGPHVEGVPLDDAALRPVLDAAVELRVPLVVHPYYVGSSTGLDDFYLTNLQGNPWQTAVCASRLILSGVLDQLPGLDVVLVHGGGHLPYQIGRLDHGHRVRPEAARSALPPSEYLRRFYYDTLTHRPEATRWLVGQVGADRVMYGTDIPFDMGGGPLDEQLDGFEGSAEAVAAIGHGNAECLFALSGGATRG